MKRLLRLTLQANGAVNRDEAREMVQLLCGCQAIVRT